MGMIDISEKKNVPREAWAEGILILKNSTIESIKNGVIKKGDPCKAAEVAGLLAVKNLCHCIPHCHPIPLTSSSIDFTIKEDKITCTCMVKATYKTGVEIEALHGVMIALLTVFDMVKYLEKDTDGQYLVARIENMRVIKKVKGE